MYYLGIFHEGGKALGIVAWCVDKASGKAGIGKER
jgi:hypothetical protein